MQVRKMQLFPLLLMATVVAIGSLLLGAFFDGNFCIEATEIESKEEFEKPAILESSLRSQRDLAGNEAGDEGDSRDEQSCIIRMKRVDRVPGKCVKLKHGWGGCQSDRYLDPDNAECEEEEEEWQEGE